MLPQRAGDVEVVCVCVFVSVLLICFAWLVTLTSFVIPLAAVCVCLLVRRLEVSQNEVKQRKEQNH